MTNCGHPGVVGFQLIFYRVFCFYFFTVLTTGIQVDGVDQGQACLGAFPLLAPLLPCGDEGLC